MGLALRFKHVVVKCEMLRRIVNTPCKFRILASCNTIGAAFETQKKHAKTRMSYTQHVSISTQSNKKINDLGACNSGARSLIAIHAQCMT